MIVSETVSNFLDHQWIDGGESATDEQDPHVGPKSVSGVTENDAAE